MPSLSASRSPAQDATMAILSRISPAESPNLKAGGPGAGRPARPCTQSATAPVRTRQAGSVAQQRLRRPLRPLHTSPCCKSMGPPPPAPRARLPPALTPPSPSLPARAYGIRRSAPRVRAGSACEAAAPAQRQRLRASSACAPAAPARRHRPRWLSWAGAGPAGPRAGPVLARPLIARIHCRSRLFGLGHTQLASLTSPSPVAGGGSPQIHSAGLSEK
jgi:hypothetical protein